MVSIVFFGEQVKLSPKQKRQQSHPVLHALTAAGDKRGVDLISDVLPFGRLWYGEPQAIKDAIGYAKFYSRSPDAGIRVHDNAGNVTETHERARNFKEP